LNLFDNFNVLLKSKSFNGVPGLRSDLKNKHEKKNMTHKSHFAVEKRMTHSFLFASLFLSSSQWYPSRVSTVPQWNL
jgi:hypothetical protein